MSISASMVKELRTKTGAGMMDCKKALVETEGNIDKAIEWLREKGISKAAKKADRIAAEGLCNIAINGNKAVVFELNSETDFVAKNESFLSLLDTVGNGILSSNSKTVEEALKSKVGSKTIEEILIDATAKIGEKFTLRRMHLLEKTDSQTFGGYKHMGGRIAALTIVEGDNEEAAKDVALHIAAMNPKYLNKDSVSKDVIETEREALTKEALEEGKPKNIVDKMVIGRINKFLKEICLLSQPFVKNPDFTVEKFLTDSKANLLSYFRLEVGEGIEKAEVDFASEVMAQVKG